VSESLNLLLSMIESESADDCWIWPGRTRGKVGHRRGYLTIGNKKYATHRFSYELLRGPIPRGLELDHICRTPLCFNPAHLEPVTHLENVRRGDGTKATATHCAHGHLFTSKTTYVDSTGTRHCTECQRIGKRRRRAAARERRTFMSEDVQTTRGAEESLVGSSHSP